MTRRAALRAIPSVDWLLQTPSMAELITRHGRDRVLEATRVELDMARKTIAKEPAPFVVPRFVDACTRRLEQRSQPSIRRVFNLTGTVIHTNLGRALLPPCAVEAVTQAMTRSVNLEYIVRSGERGERDAHVETLLTRLTGAEAALIVNNNAAAVFLTLNTLGPNREVIISRGELVEIGGAFRIPDIMARAGCRLIEVGTTNRTHPRDYEAAITPETAALMRVHASNYSIEGFTSAVADADLATLAHDHELPVITDLGSGTLIDFTSLGLPHETTAREAIESGADLVTFSGDKLLGGPQAGIIVGKRALIERLRQNPIKRALRVDKMTLAALEAVLRLYESPGRISRELPILRFLTRSTADIREQCERLLPVLQQVLDNRAAAAIADVRSQIGSGSLPVDLLPSHALSVNAVERRRTFASEMAHAFRHLPIPVIGRISQGRYLMDLRCLDDEAGFARQLAQLEFGTAE